VSIYITQTAYSQCCDLLRYKSRSNRRNIVEVTQTFCKQYVLPRRWARGGGKVVETDRSQPVHQGQRK